MEENYCKERSYKTFLETIKDSFYILKKNILIYLGVAIIMSVLVSVTRYLRVSLSAGIALNGLYNLIGLLMAGVMSLVYAITSYNTLYPAKKKPIGHLITSNILPMILTQLLLGVIVILPLFFITVIVASFVTFFVIFSGSYNSASLAIMIIVIIGLCISIIKFSFLSHAVILSDRKYWEAIKWSWKKTSGHVGMIFVTYLIPIVILLCVFFIIRVSASEDLAIIITSILSAILNIFIAVAVSVIYMDVVLDEDDDKLEEISVCEENI